MTIDSYYSLGYYIEELLIDGTRHFVVKNVPKGESIQKLVSRFPSVKTFEPTQRQIEFHNQTGKTKLCK